MWNLMHNAITFKDKFNLIKFILSTNKFTNGKKVEEFEAAWNDWLGSEYSLFVSSGSCANLLLVSAIKELYGLKPNDKVLVPACTWTTNVSPLIQLGLQPIFCDINFDDFSFKHSDLYYIKKIHPDIKLIFVTHLLGFPSYAQCTGLLKTLFPHALIIDDVCEAHGCEDVTGDKIGSDSLGATFSTYFGHLFTTIEGGFVSTNNEALYDLMKMKRSHGMAKESIMFDQYIKKYPDIDKHFMFITDGYNFRNTELNAVLGLSQLKRLDNFIEIRNKNFFEFTQIIHRHSDKFYPIHYSNGVSNFCLPFICKTTKIFNNLKRVLVENKIEYRPIVSGNLLRHPFLKGYELCREPNGISNVDILHERGLYIGNNQFITHDNIRKLNSVLRCL